MTAIDSHANDQSTPLISVCVPMYNNSTTIERCLRSVLEQDSDFEILVIDDGSSDDSVALAAKMLRARDRLICNDARLGANRNHNKCIQLARGDYIQFVHGDDWLLPGALPTLARRFDDPTVGLTFAPRRVLTDDMLWLERCGMLHTRFGQLDEYNHGPALVMQMTLHGLGTNWIGEPTCVMFRRQLAVDIGCLRADIAHLADMDLWLRLLLRSAACFVPDELSVRHHTAFTADDFAQRSWWLDRLHLLTWMVMDPASPPRIRIVAAAWWLPVWLLRALEVLVYGPNRWSRAMILAAAPYREFARARRLRVGL